VKRNLLVTDHVLERVVLYTLVWRKKPTLIITRSSAECALFSSY
jgi:hypothetical protein